ncbi:helix-turn-helix domain-containing protein [Streptomyces flaveolus]|uniref:helix-turn-helix domain-containing protein n=1 Tax=Streptomyces flaveolus TaxID=67297 RepID=UPI003F4B3054
MRAVYAGMRTLPVPGAPVARLWHSVTMLREHRGHGHVAALVGARIGGTDELAAPPYETLRAPGSRTSDSLSAATSSSPRTKRPSSPTTSCTTAAMPCGICCATPCPRPCAVPRNTGPSCATGSQAAGRKAFRPGSGRGPAFSVRPAASAGLPLTRGSGISVGALFRPVPGRPPGRAVRPRPGGRP